jgi:hypothetical protein
MVTVFEILGSSHETNCPMVTSDSELNVLSPF